MTSLPGKKITPCTDGSFGHVPNYKIYGDELLEPQASRLGVRSSDQVRLNGVDAEASASAKALV